MVRKKLLYFWKERTLRYIGSRRVKIGFVGSAGLICIVANLCEADLGSGVSRALTSRGATQTSAASSARVRNRFCIFITKNSIIKISNSEIFLGC